MFLNERLAKIVTDCGLSPRGAARASSSKMISIQVVVPGSISLFGYVLKDVAGVFFGIRASGGVAGTVQARISYLRSLIG